MISKNKVRWGVISMACMDIVHHDAYLRHITDLMGPRSEKCPMYDDRTRDFRPP